jgi:hypothetical protein
MIWDLEPEEQVVLIMLWPWPSHSMFLKQSVIWKWGDRWYYLELKTNTKNSTWHLVGTKKIFLEEKKFPFMKIKWHQVMWKKFGGYIAQFEYWFTYSLWTQFTLLKSSIFCVLGLAWLFIQYYLTWGTCPNSLVYIKTTEREADKKECVCHLISY